VAIALRRRFGPPAKKAEAAGFKVMERTPMAAKPGPT
jgi:hypothetical protein